MKKNLYILLNWALVLGVVSGCNTDTITPIELADYNNRIVVNGILDTKNQIQIEVTDSKSAFSTDFPNLIKDAEVKLFQNQNEIPLNYDLFEEKFRAAQVLSPGDAVTLRISHPDYPLADVQLRMPESLNPVGQLQINGGVDSTGNIADKLSVTFQDEEGRNNYYRINFYYFNRTLGRYIPMSFDITDPSLASYNSYRLNDNSVLFTDDLFKGGTKTISTIAPAGIVSNNPNEKYKIEISSITSDLFKYYKSLQRARDAAEITFNAGYNNAVVIHSNVRGGLGILGAMDLNEIELK